MRLTHQHHLQLECRVNPTHALQAPIATSITIIVYTSSEPYNLEQEIFMIPCAILGADLSSDNLNVIATMLTVCMIHL